MEYFQVSRMSHNSWKSVVMEMGQCFSTLRQAWFYCVLVDAPASKMNCTGLYLNNGSSILSQDVYRRTIAVPKLPTLMHLRAPITKLYFSSLRRRCVKHSFTDDYLHCSPLLSSALALCHECYSSAKPILPVSENLWSCIWPSHFCASAIKSSPGWCKEHCNCFPCATKLGH